MVKAWALVTKFDRRWLLAMAGAIGLYALWVGLQPESQSRALVALLMLVALQSAAAILVTGTAREAPSDRGVRAWRFFGIALMLWVLSHALEAAAWGIRGAIAAPPSGADLLRMGGYLAAIAAAVSFPVSPPERFGRLREVLNVAIVVLAVICLAWLIFIRPVVALDVAPLATIYWSSVRPVLDLVLFALILRVLVLLQAGRGRGVMGWLLFGFGFIAISDFSLGFSMLLETRRIGTIADAGWMMGTIGFMSAAVLARRRGRMQLQATKHLLERLFPIVFTYAVIGFTLFDWLFTGSPDYVGLVSGALIVLLLVARQGVIAGQRELRGAFQQVEEARAQLQVLNLELEDKVEARTLELENMVNTLAKTNEELKQLDKLKTEFVALVSHELRAPLTNIKGGLELLQRKVKDRSHSPEKSIELIQQEVARLAGFVEKILDISALESGKFPIHLSAIPLDLIAEQACSGFVNAGGERLKLSIPDDLPDVFADERGLKSVFAHLIDNALKYAPEGDIRIEASQENGNVRVAVIDVGPGIPESERERAFDIFHRMDGSDSREVYGYGLGLHLSKRLIEEMGGRIHAEETQGGGASLIFILPAAS